jgi:shikimate dehydrogenase
MDISGRTRMYCLIGDPVEHSLSPFIMNRAFADQDLDCVYVAFRVSREDLPHAVTGLRAGGVLGANVTYPHKEAVLSFVDHLSERVKVLGAANTLCLAEDGLHAHNTDAPGIPLALQRLGNQSLKGRRTLIFGAGGAGRAAALGLLEAGAASVVFCEMFPARVEGPVERLAGAFPGREVSLLPMSAEASETRRTAVEESEIVINATPVVAGPAVNPLVEPLRIRPDQVCFELSYHPRVTPFLETARRRGAACLDGLCLLAAQAYESFRRWTGLEFDLEATARALAEHTGSELVCRKE